MKHLAKITATAMLATSISGCSLADLANLAGVPLPPQQSPYADIDGDGMISQGEIALSSYSRSYSDGNNNVTDAQVVGVEGVAAGSATSSSAASSVGTFRKGRVSMAADKSTMVVSIDGQAYTLPKVGDAIIMNIGGRPFTTYGFGIDPSTTNNNVPGNVGATINGDYASLTWFVKNGTWTTNQLTSHNGWAMIANGLETPTSGIPTQLVSYQGQFFLIVDGAQNKTGTFTADLNFNTKTLNGSLSGTDYNHVTNTDNGPFASTIAGKISGSQFTATANQSGSKGFNGEIAGAVYGPNAEEIAGAMNGTYGSHGAGGVNNASGGMIGSKQ